MGPSRTLYGMDHWAGIENIQESILSFVLPFLYFQVFRNLAVLTPSVALPSQEYPVKGIILFTST